MQASSSRRPQELCCWWCGKRFKPEVWISRNTPVVCSDQCNQFEKVFQVFSKAWKWSKE